MKTILRSINNFSCKLKQNNNLKYNISPKIRGNKFKNISGNGNIVIEDALNKNLKDYKIYGNTYQNSTRGVNLFNHYLYPENNTLNGITIKNNGDGSFTLNGTCTQNNTSFLLGLERTIREYAIEGPVTQTAYYISGSCTKGTSSPTRTTIRLNYNIGYNKMIPLEKLSTQGVISRTVSQPGETIGWSWTISLNEGDTFDNFTIKYQLEKGSVATEYEPYTGGQPSPNPDYPQEIISCGDRTKNLFDINLSQSISNATKSVDGNNLTITCNANNQNCYVSYDTSNINFNKTYYFSYTAIADNYAGVMIRAYKNDNTYEVIVDFTQTTKANLNFKVPDNTVYLRTFLYASRSTTGGSVGNKTIYSNVHLREEPYGYKIPVNVRSDNLFDKDNVNILNAYINSSKIITTSEYDKTLYIKCKPNTTYTISKMISSPTNQNKFRVCTTINIPTIGTTGIDYVGYNTGTEITNITITTSLSANYLCVFMLNVNSSTTTLEEILNSIMIVEGSTAPSKYIPYYNQTTNIYLDEPLRKIDEYSDYIDFINGKVVRNINEIILNGSEDWASASASNIYSRFVCTTYNDALIPQNLSTIGKILSDKFISKTANETASAITGIAIAGSGRFVIYYDLTKEYNVTQFKTWLSSNNVTVDYALSTPTEEDIELPNINLIEGKNIITIGTEVYGVFEVEYYSKEIIDISNYKYNLRKVED